MYMINSPTTLDYYYMEIFKIFNYVYLPCETGHIVLGQLLPGQHLEERDVQQRTPGQTLDR